MAGVPYAHIPYTICTSADFHQGIENVRPIIKFSAEE